MMRVWRSVMLVLLAAGAAASAAGQEPRRGNFRAVNYDLTAALIPADQMLQARARVDFEAREASLLVDVELHSNLKVTAVTTPEGKAVSFDRDLNDPLRLRVTLPEPVGAGKRVSLVFQYSGLLANEENSPVKDVRLAYIGEDSAYLLLPARWFPLTDFPANRFTAKFSITVPDKMSVVGTGKMSGPQPAAPQPPAPKGEQPAAPSAARVVYTFVFEQPLAGGTFLAGNLLVSPVSAEGLTAPVYAPADAGENAASYGQAAAAAAAFFSAQFGPLPDRTLALAQMPAGSLQAFAAPGILLIGRRQWTPQVNARLIARLVAGQWWGGQILPATPNDVWLTDGLARYSEAMYFQQQAGEEGFNKALEEFAVGALTYEDSAPVAQAGRLGAYSPEYNSVVVNKGALVFHMLRSQLGDEAFAALLRDFYAKFAGKSATIGDFQRLAQAQADAKAGDPRLNLGPFFANWLNSTGLPEFKLEYVVQRIRTGFRIIGTVKQPLETFRMPVKVRVVTDGNPEVKTIDVVGTESSFSIDTFGRPKPGGITLDPDNTILKSSPAMRVRAAIARGEELAQAGRFYDAVLEYQQALELQRSNALAAFRMGEAFFFQKNYQAAANAFRDALDGAEDPATKWVTVWSHIYLGKIFDIGGQRDRAVNEYSKARDTNDNTGGAQEEIEKLLKEPYQEKTP